MDFYEAAAAIAVATTLLAFAARRGKAKRFAAIEDRVHLWTTVASSLCVAIAVIAGLVFLSSENLTATSHSQQAEMDHSSAVHRIYFRH